LLLIPFMNPDKTQKQVTEQGDRDPHGSEVGADEKRPGGPRYHGAGWERSKEETERGVEEPGAPRADDPVRVDSSEGQVPGAKGKKRAGQAGAATDIHGKSGSKA
jgi:hypothetical protein